MAEGGCVVIVRIVNRKPLVVLGLRACLESTPGIEVQAGLATEPSIRLGSVDVLLLDSEMAGEQPGCPALREMALRTSVLVTASTARVEDNAAFLRAGAKGCIDYEMQPTEIVDLVRAAGGDEWALPAAREPRIDVLSPREHAVLTYIAQGFTHEQTARRMAISKHTVDTYIKRARAKLRLGNKAELTRAVLNGSPPR
jgi:DNA-binding NarL/FixJ family response regulator